MRLPYVSNPPQTNTPEEPEILTRVQSRRAPGALQAIDLTLLLAQPIASSWVSFFGAVRNQSTIPQDIREILILRVAALCDSKYEIHQHSPYARQAGVSEPGIRAMLAGSRDELSGIQYLPNEDYNHDSTTTNNSNLKSPAT
jgi:alkylhydroperoxidase family enzyme